jgi:hypothetical protein
MDELATAGSVAQERLGNIRTVRALGNDSLEVARYERATHTATQRSLADKDSEADMALYM